MTWEILIQLISNGSHLLHVGLVGLLHILSCTAPAREVDDNGPPIVLALELQSSLCPDRYCLSSSICRGVSKQVVDRIIVGMREQPQFSECTRIGQTARYVISDRPRLPLRPGQYRLASKEGFYALPYEEQQAGFIAIQEGEPAAFGKHAGATILCSSSDGTTSYMEEYFVYKNRGVYHLVATWTLIGDSQRRSSDE